MNRRTIVTGVVFTAILLVVAGCGRRGALEAPPNAQLAPPPPVQKSALTVPTPTISTNSDVAERNNNDSDEVEAMALGTGPVLDKSAPTSGGYVKGWAYQAKPSATMVPPAPGRTRPMKSSNNSFPLDPLVQ
ncbi:lipoprotein [Flaviflagellibacter deserti]|jgi:predicted small lipoprotein YifL|uniref:Lipoprotein n=1 Tax=Flaviflagellibacter deserti TaxID=2267266 RepID=A0ABV9Z1F5_9HYPH